MSHLNAITILSLIVILAVCVRSHEEHGINDLIDKPNKAKMCDPGVMSDALAVKLDKCDESYSTAVEKEIEKFENLYHDCDKKEKEFFAKFKKLKKEDNQHHLHHACDELSDKCYDSYFAKLNEVGIKHKKSLNDCYSKLAKCDDEHDKVYEKVKEKFEYMTLKCNTKDNAFFAKFKNLTNNEDNNNHLYYACKELDLSCYDKYWEKVHDEAIKLVKSSLNDCYSKIMTNALLPSGYKQHKR
ncbi:unnamed protein product [Oppiella nova]|uniref:Uncharacterized protein n=1 Tax=Oppiella nova TaxID=334625 RepID=A0A7R9QS77_9ACAR|nr:unnamed protein product [Oppiella nova]CAG2171989.1 unnamed protein product [Oppiella nova]